MTAEKKADDDDDDLLKDFDFNLPDHFIKRTNSIDDTAKVVVPPIKNSTRASVDFGQMSSTRSVKSNNSMYNSFNLNTKKKL